MGFVWGLLDANHQMRREIGLRRKFVVVDCIPKLRRMLDYVKDGELQL